MISAQWAGPLLSKLFSETAQAPYKLALACGWLLMSPCPLQMPFRLIPSTEPGEDVQSGSRLALADYTWEDGFIL